MTRCVASCISSRSSGVEHHHCSATPAPSLVPALQSGPLQRLWRCCPWVKPSGRLAGELAAAIAGVGCTCWMPPKPPAVLPPHSAEHAGAPVVSMTWPPLRCLPACLPARPPACLPVCLPSPLPAGMTTAWAWRLMGGRASSQRSPRRRSSPPCCPPVRACCRSCGACCVLC